MSTAFVFCAVASQRVCPHTLSATASASASVSAYVYAYASPSSSSYSYPCLRTRSRSPVVAESTRRTWRTTTKLHMMSSITPSPKQGPYENPSEPKAEERREPEEEEDSTASILSQLTEAVDQVKQDVSSTRTTTSRHNRNAPEENILRGLSSSSASRYSPEMTDSQLRKADRESVQDINLQGQQEIAQILSDFEAQLSNLSLEEALEAADQQVQILVSSMDQKRAVLLEQIVREQLNIKAESQKIQLLAQEYERQKNQISTVTNRASLYLLLSTVCIAAAGYFALGAIESRDWTTAAGNVGTDLVIAAIFFFLHKREIAKSE